MMSFTTNTMHRLFHPGYILLVLLSCCLQTQAQIGMCTAGMELSVGNYVGYNMNSAGDLKINSTGSLEIGPGGNYNVFGAVTNNGSIIVRSGGVLTIYGNIKNNGSIIINQGGIVNFYGSNFQNLSSASYGGRGNLYFTGSRPLIPAAWSTSVPCLLSYSGSSFTQYLDGGGSNIRMKVDVHINNPSNVVLNSSTFLADSLFFDVNDGHLLLGNNNLILSGTSKASGYNQLRYVVTDGTGNLVKDSLAPAVTFEFPVGRAESDYTPATITNNASAYDVFNTQVKSYSESASDEAVPEEGMYRTWNIYSSLGSAASLKLQHNSSTNDPGAYTDNGSDIVAFVTQYIGSGIWQTGVGATGTDAAGTVSGSRTHFRSYSATATSPVSSGAFFSKSSNILFPLPVSILSFDAQPIAYLKSSVSWSTSNDNTIRAFRVLKWDTETGKYKELSQVASRQSENNVISYEYRDLNASVGVNLYRLEVIYRDGHTSLTDIKAVKFDEIENGADISLFPNPSGDSKILNIIGNENISDISIADSYGRIVYSAQPMEKSAVQLDITNLAAGVYTINVNGKVYVWVR